MANVHEDEHQLIVAWIAQGDGGLVGDIECHRAPDRDAAIRLSRFSYEMWIAATGQSPVVIYWGDGNNSANEALGNTGARRITDTFNIRK